MPKRNRNRRRANKGAGAVSTADAGAVAIVVADAPPEVQDSDARVAEALAAEERAEALARRGRFDAAKAALEAHLPRPLLQEAPPAVPRFVGSLPEVRRTRVQHILPGDATGGQHAGRFNADSYKDPDQGKFNPTLYKSYFPVAWTDEDVIDAIREAAALTYNYSTESPNNRPGRAKRWVHMPIKVTRRVISIWLKVITEDLPRGGYQVITAYPLV